MLWEALVWLILHSPRSILIGATCRLLTNWATDNFYSLSHLLPYTGARALSMNSRCVKLLLFFGLVNSKTNTAPDYLRLSDPKDYVWVETHHCYRVINDFFLCFHCAKHRITIWCQTFINYLLLVFRPTSRLCHCSFLSPSSTNCIVLPHFPLLSRITCFIT